MDEQTKNECSIGETALHDTDVTEDIIEDDAILDSKLQYEHHTLDIGLPD